MWRDIFASLAVIAVFIGLSFGSYAGLRCVYQLGQENARQAEMARSLEESP
jgi:hypothetical protein